jgi:peptide methionine sulfoxide reductase MsrB
MVLVGDIWLVTRYHRAMVNDLRDTMHGMIRTEVHSGEAEGYGAYLNQVEDVQ